MAFEDNDVLTQLSQAPPNAPTAQDAEAAKASAAAQQLVDASTAPRPLGQPDASGFRSGVDVAKDAAASKPVVPPNHGTQMAAAFQDLLKIAPDMSSEPGGISRGLIAASLSALLGRKEPVDPSAKFTPTNVDTTTPTKAPPTQRAPFGQPVMSLLGDLAGPERGLAGFAKATTQRQTQEQKDRVVMAASNAQMLHEQGLVHKQGVDAIDDAIKSGQTSVKELIESVPGAGANSAGHEDFKGKTSDELTQMLQKGLFDPSVQTAFPTGKIVTGKDANGFPIYRTTYSVITPAKHVKITPEIAKALNENGSEYPVSDDPAKQQEMDGVQLNHSIQQANNAKATKRAFQVEEAKADETIRKAQTSKDAQTVFQNPVVMNARLGHDASKPGSPDPFAVVKTFDYFMNHPEDVKRTGIPNFADAYMQAAGGENYFKGLREEYQKSQAKSVDVRDSMIKEYTEHPDKISHNTPAVIAATDSILNDPTQKGTKQYNDAQRLKIQALNTQALEKTLEGERELDKEEIKRKAQQRASASLNPQGLTGEAFIKTLPVGRANALRNFANGTLVLNPTALERTDKGQAYLDDISAAYPDLDASRAPAYAKTRINFSTGKEAAGINSSNAAIHHLNRMDANLNQATAGYTGSVEQFFGLNPAGRAVADDAQAVSGELGKLYTGGVVTEGEKKEWEEKLNPKGFGMTVGKLKTNVAEFTRLLGGKLEAYQDQWDDAVPSKAIPAPMAIASPESIATYKRLTGEDLKVHSVQPSSVNAPSGPPTGATHKVPGPDGKVHWTNEKGTVDYGVVQ